MNHSEYYSNEDEVPPATWPDGWTYSREDNALYDMGDFSSYPSSSVPQSTYPEQVFGPEYPTVGSYVPDFNAADYAAFSLDPTTEMWASENPSVPQDVFDPWSTLAPCMFLSCIRHDPLYSLECESKALVDANSAASQPQLAGDLHWAGVDPLATYPVAGCL